VNRRLSIIQLVKSAILSIDPVDGWQVQRTKMSKLLSKITMVLKNILFQENIRPV
jgi:hypothetical protein